MEKEKREYFMNMFSDMLTVENAEEIEKKLMLNISKLTDKNSSSNNKMLIMNFILFGALMKSLEIDFKGSAVEEVIEAFHEVELITDNE